jgi:hypothetical protein
LIGRTRIKAKEYGIEREDNLAKFLDLVIMYGQEFCKAPWAADVLQSEAIHGPDKIALIVWRVQQAGVPF